MIGAMPSGAVRRQARASTTSRRCAWERRRPLHRQSRQREQLRHAGEPHPVRRPGRGGAGQPSSSSTARATARRPGHSASRSAKTATCTARTNGPTPSRCSIRNGQVPVASGARPAAATASCCGRPASLSRRTATSSSSTAATTGCRCSRPEGKLVAQCGKAGSGDGEFNKPWGITARQGWQHLRRRLEEPPRAEAVAAGQVPNEDRHVRRAAASSTNASP